MSREPKHRRRLASPWWLFGIVLLVIGIVAVWWLTSLPYDEAKCRRQIRQGEPVVAALEAYRRDTGTYPESLHELIPKYLAVMPALEGVEAADRLTDEAWGYDRTEPTNFVLWTPSNHWVSSFDALIYSTAPLDSLGLPKDRDKYRAYEIDDWFYVVGAQHLNL